MTPFGARVRALRRARGLKLGDMARALQLSPAYLSALEHGHRGRPTPALVVQICEYLHLIWDDYEEMHRLARLSHPKIAIDTAGLAPEATEAANLLAERIGGMSAAEIAQILAILRRTTPKD